MFDPVAYINEPRWQTMSLGLERISELLERLGNPQEHLRFVHVAGTNGKGSTCAFMARILQESGYKVGLFTSPYIEYFEERIRINGRPISREALCEVTLLVRDVAEAMEEHPTEFELMTAVAFLYFAREECDVVVAEVGLGGRLDSTNIIKTVEVGLIAPISYDHCALLGNTLSEIAHEKAGIIKPGMAVVSAKQEDEAARVLTECAAQKGASLRFVNVDSLQGANDDFSYCTQQQYAVESRQEDVLKEGPASSRQADCASSSDKEHVCVSNAPTKTYDHLHLSLLGSYQRFNAALAIEGCEVLRQKGWGIPDEALYKGLAHAYWPGRFELISIAPDVLIDGAHNIHAARQLVHELDQRYPLRRIIFCLGVMADKDHQEMLELYAPLAKAFICYAPFMDRALPAHKLATEAMKTLAQLPEEEHGQGCVVQIAASPAQALHTAFEIAGEHDVICCCGSLYGIAALKEAFSQEIPKRDA